MIRASRTWRAPKETEHDHQVTLFQWAALNQRKYPALALMFAIANGGHRYIAVARKLKAEGVRAGVPDIHLPVSVNYGPHHYYHGLFIELKIGKSKPTAIQKWWHERLMDQGYKVAVCYGWVEARDAIVAYLEGKG